jgi:hypothetical protein
VRGDRGRAYEHAAVGSLYDVRTMPSSDGSRFSKSETTVRALWWERRAERVASETGHAWEGVTLGSKEGTDAQGLLTLNPEARKVHDVPHRTRSGWLGVALAHRHPYTDINHPVSGAWMHLRRVT